LHSSINKKSTVPSILLATAQITIIAPNSNTTQIRALIDQGSEISLISERLAQRLRLIRTRSSIPLVGIGAQQSNKTKGIVTFTLKPHFDSTFESTISAHVFPKLTTTIPSFQIISPSWPHLDGLQLADPKFNVPGTIDLILGAEIYAGIIEEGIIKGQTGAPIAQLTSLGWIISGPTSTSTSTQGASSYHVSINEQLYQLIHKFWELEEVPTVHDSSLSVAEQDCERHFKTNFSRDTQGRYIVKLPFKQSPEKLGDSKKKATHVMTRLSNKLQSDSKYAQLYTDFMDEYVRLRTTHGSSTEFTT